MILTLLGVVFGGLTFVLVVRQTYVEIKNARKKRIPNMIKLPESDFKHLVSLQLNQFTLQNIGGVAVDFTGEDLRPEAVKTIRNREAISFQLDSNIKNTTIKYKSQKGNNYCQKIEFPLNANVVVSEPVKIK